MCGRTQIASALCVVRRIEQMDESARALWKEQRVAYVKVKQENTKLISLRPTFLLRYNIANRFQNVEKLYFPHNVDFRGG